MNVTRTLLPGVVLIEPRVFEDERGFFLETYREDQYLAQVTGGLRFVQDNHSRSSYGVLRGLHLQTRRPQGKLVRCVLGEVFDVAVDVNPRSGTFGQWVSVRLSAKRKNQIYIPPGYAHGFQVLSDFAEIEYKCTDVYDPEGEAGLVWNDADVGIEWPLSQVTLSEKDSKLPGLASFR